jgi:O-antigen ligase
MIDFRNAVRMPAELRDWSPLWRVVVIAIGVGIFGCLAYLAFLLALGSTGCLVFNWGFFGSFCGTKTGIALSIAVLVLPIAAYLGIKRPMLFPVAMYAFLVPLDSFLNLTSGGTITKLLAIICAGVIVLRLLRTGTFSKPGLGTLLWFFYFTYATASILWAFLPDKIEFAFYTTFAQLLIFYLAIAMMPITEEEFRILNGAFIIGAMAATGVSYYLYNSGNAALINEGRLKAHLEGGNGIASDQFSASLIFPMALAMMGALRQGWNRLKLANLAAVGVMLIGQFIVGSRGGILGDGFVMAWFLLKSKYRGQIVGVGIFGFVMSLVVPSAIWARFLTPDPTGGSNRVAIWHVAWSAFKHRPIFGQGFGNFHEIYDHYFLTVFQPFTANWDRASHSLVVGTAVELGIVGVGLMLLAWFTNFKLVSGITKTSKFYDLRIAVEGGIIGMFVSALFVDIMLNKWTWWAFTTAAFVRTLWLRERAAQSESLPEEAAPEPAPLLAPRPALEMLRGR